MAINTKHTTALKLLMGAVFGAASLGAFAADDAPQAPMSRGAYIARAADCAACHTGADSEKPYAGGYAIESPLGTIYATNITPSKTAGIGNWSEAQFAKAVRQGISADGHRLYPAMPYADYAGISDDDIHALYTYLTTEVAPVDTPPQQVTKLGFPYNIRAVMAVWNGLFVKAHDTSTPPSQQPLERGRYLVDTLGHCGSCHTPRNLLMASDNDHYMEGGDVGGWHAPNITSDPVSGLGGWSEDELAQFLKTGHAKGRAQAAGGMAEAVEHSLRYLSDSDLHAMAAYLKSIPAKPTAGQDKPAFGYGQLPDTAYGFDDKASLETLRAAAATTPTGDALLASRTYTDVPKVEDGARLYADACASCHQPNGSGTADQYYPSLVHNSTVGSAKPNNLVMAILQGVHRTGADGPTFMPAFGRDMTDAQVAAVASYVAQRFGNPDMKVDARQVAQLRAGGPTPALKTWTPWLMGLAGLVLLLIVVAVLRRKRQRKIR